MSVGATAPHHASVRDALTEELYALLDELPAAGTVDVLGPPNRGIGDWLRRSQDRLFEAHDLRGARPPTDWGAAMLGDLLRVCVERRVALGPPLHGWLQRRLGARSESPSDGRRTELELLWGALSGGSVPSAAADGAAAAEHGHAPLPPATASGSGA